MNSRIEKEQENQDQPSSRSSQGTSQPLEQEAPEENSQPEAAQRLEMLEAELAQQKDRMLRVMADAENIRKRALRDAEEAARYGVSSMAKDLLDVSENLHRALESIPPEQRSSSPAMQSLAEGVEMTLKALLSAFEKHGIRRISPLEDKFDHNYHQAVSQIPSADHPPGTVVQVLQAGYMLHDRLLRPAMVCVSTAPSSEKKVDTLV